MRYRNLEQAFLTVDDLDPIHAVVISTGLATSFFAERSSCSHQNCRNPTGSRITNIGGEVRVRGRLSPQRNTNMG